MKNNSQREKKYKDEKINNAVVELGNYRARQRQIIYLTEKLVEYENNQYIKAQDYEKLRVAGGKFLDTVSEIASTWADLEKYVRKLRSDAEIEIIYIGMVLNALTSVQRQVLVLYYLEGYTISKTAKTLDYSEEHIRRLKYSALKNYAILKDELQMSYKM